MALVKLPNIRPTINIAMVSRRRWDTKRTAIKTRKLPMQEDSTIPYDESNSEVANVGRNAAPRMTKATPRLEPELSPRT